MMPTNLMLMRYAAAYAGAAAQSLALSSSQPCHHHSCQPRDDVHSGRIDYCGFAYRQRRITLHRCRCCAQLCVQIESLFARSLSSVSPSSAVRALSRPGMACVCLCVCTGMRYHTHLCVQLQPRFMLHDEHDDCVVFVTDDDDGAGDGVRLCCCCCCRPVLVGQFVRHLCRVEATWRRQYFM